VLGVPEGEYEPKTAEKCRRPRAQSDAQKSEHRDAGRDMPDGEHNLDAYASSVGDEYSPKQCGKRSGSSHGVKIETTVGSLALKQTMVILLPVLWGLWRRLDRALLTAVFAISALSYGVFLLWDAGALWKDVLFHMGTPFRKDALTLSAFLVHFLGVSPLPSWLSLVGLVGGSIAALFALRPAEGGVSPCDSDRLWRFFVGLAFALLLTLVLSKHAFMNYYYMVHFVMIQALVWSRVTDREATTA